MRQWLYQLSGALFLLVCAGGVQAVDLILPDLEGRDRSLAEFRGQWLLVNFWASWCPPCIEEMPELERFHLAHKERDAMVIGINMEDMTPQQLKVFLQRRPVSYPVLLAPVDGYTSLGRISVLPTSILISPEGEEVIRHAGSITVEMIEQWIEQGERSRPPALINKKSGSVQ